MKTAAVLVVMWHLNGATTSQQIEMKTLDGCKAEVTRLQNTGAGIPKTTWMFCVERK